MDVANLDPDGSTLPQGLNYKANEDALTIGIKYREQADVLAEEKAHIEALNAQLTQQTKALQVSEARFRGLSEAAFEGITIHDNGRILDVNRAAAEMFGYTQAELVAMILDDLIPSDSREIVAKTELAETKRLLRSRDYAKMAQCSR